MFGGAGSWSLTPRGAKLTGFSGSVGFGSVTEEAGVGGAEIASVTDSGAGVGSSPRK